MPHDFGPQYLETNMNQFPVEPWNTFSNLIFLLIFVFWAYKTGLNYRRHKLLTIGLPILFVGYIGGTVYHATRSHNIWLIMDFMPISILCLMLSYSYWLKLLKKHWIVLGCVFLPFVVLRMGLSWLPLEKNVQITIGYCLLSALAMMPLFTYAIKNKLPAGKYLIAAALVFCLAIFFRLADSQQAELVKIYLPMGSHWLWHILGGVAAHFAILFVYEDALTY